MPRTLVIIFLISGTACGCTRLVPSFYEIDIRQGNYFDQAMVDQLRPGMTKRQVQFLFGTPLLIDPFNPNRWDYVYRFREGGEGLQMSRHITLYFDGDVLTRIEDRIDRSPQEETG